MAATLKLLPAAATEQLRAHGAAWWHAGDAAKLSAACAAVPDAALMQWPAVARWRALAALLTEHAEALPCLEQAHAGHLAAGDAAAALVDAHIALAFCLIDIGAMDRVTDWLQRSAAAAPPLAAEPGLALWLQLGRVARVVLDPAQYDRADDALVALQARLGPLAEPLAAHERLLLAQLLINGHFTRQRYEQFDLVASLIEQPAQFAAAPALMRARWHYTLGFAYYQVGRADSAQAAWQQAIELCTAHELEHIGLMAALAMLRLHLDRGRLDDAEVTLAAIQPRWGAGRSFALIALQQMRARLWLLRGQPARAQATLDEALALADLVGLSTAERASCLTDQAQVLIALDRVADAAALLARLAQTHTGRDAAVYRCLLGLLQAWRQHEDDAVGSRKQLAAALQDAQLIRYSMFYRLLPALAAQICALALQWQIEPVFVTEVIRARDLPAPAQAGAHWPWHLWLRMFGGFELRLLGQTQQRAGKSQQKPLELLRLLGCQRQLSLAMRHAADSLWPDADGSAAQKSLEMTIQRLRRLLGDDNLVRVGDGSVGLDVGRASSDVLQRRRLIEALEALAMRPVADAAAQTLASARLAQQLLSGERGMLLPGAPDTPWLEAQRQLCERDLARAARAADAVLARSGGTAEQRAMLCEALAGLGAAS